jgi:putative DNA primase/helicase
MTNDNGAARQAADGAARRSPSLPEALRQAGIGLKSHKDGQHRARCPCCDRGKQRPDDIPLTVRLNGTGATFYCFRCGWTGGLWTCRDCGGASPSRICPCQQAQGEQAAKERPPRRPDPPPPKVEVDPAKERKRELAQEIWRQTEAIADGLPFDYLARRRGIAVWDCDRVRWHPRCPWKGGIAGCILVPITDHATGYVVGIWRIRPAMRGPIERRGLGSSKGNAARLFDAPGPELIVTEGVEDALAAHALFGAPAWAALSAGNMAKLILPPRIQQILILADRDEPKEDGRQVGLEAAHELARRLRAEGRSAEVRWSRIGKDANDALRGTAA